MIDATTWLNAPVGENLPHDKEPEPAASRHPFRVCG